jgi:signal transduction histidine kinase
MSGVMAEPLVKMAVVNLLKNAIKFSLPRYSGQPMLVDVFAIPQNGWNIVQIKNWGIGIEKSEYEEIFRKYHRIERVDAKRDIAGRGLGLYLARAMIRAQGGDLFCESSEATLDDPKKRQDLVGYLTTFELRLPTTNRPGTRMVRLK